MQLSNLASGAIRAQRELLFDNFSIGSEIKWGFSLKAVGFLVGDGLHNRMLDFLENEWLDTGLLTS